MQQWPCSDSLSDLESALASDLDSNLASDSNSASDSALDSDSDLDPVPDSGSDHGGSGSSSAWRGSGDTDDVRRNAIRLGRKPTPRKDWGAALKKHKAKMKLRGGGSFAPALG